MPFTEDFEWWEKQGLFLLQCHGMSSVWEGSVPVPGEAGEGESEQEGPGAGNGPGMTSRVPGSRQGVLCKLTDTPCLLGTRQQGE